DPTLKINGKTTPLNLEAGYASIRRTWKKGDVIELGLPMPVRRVRANSHVEADLGKVAMQRGPLAYCVEWPDVKDGQVVNLLLPDTAPLETEFRPEMLNGVEVIRGEAASLRYTDAKRSVATSNTPFTAIPYYAWANRGRGEMAVWLAREATAGRPLPFPTIASTSRASASSERLRPDVRALNDQREPASSGDHSNRFLHWWPHKGTKEWVQYDFAKPAKVSGTEVYWFDDSGVGECRAPQSWQLFYRVNGEWKPVEHASGYGCEKDRYNRTTFDPVETDALRLEVQLPQDFSTGIHEWRVEEAGQSSG
ncbi:MAG: discoidin domain-containing protein, partial [Limisphaerales bacterium]